MAAGSKPYRFERAARADLRHGVFWYEERREGLGRQFAADIQKAINLVLQSPSRWPSRLGTYRYVLRRFPYTIAYRLVGNQIVIVAVAHHRLDPGSWDSR